MYGSEKVNSVSRTERVGANLILSLEDVSS